MAEMVVTFSFAAVVLLQLAYANPVGVQHSLKGRAGVGGSFRKEELGARWPGVVHHLGGSGCDERT